MPVPLQGKRLLQLDVGSLVAGTMYRGQFEERLKRVIDELKSAGAILFIDEVHMLVGAGAAGSSVDAANILKPALSRGELQVIGATTLEEYRKHIESDAALERRFQPVMVEEPSIEETIQILHGVRPNYEQHHRLAITDQALEAAARLSARYVPDRFLPDKAIDLIDESSSRVRMYKSPEARKLRETAEELRKIRQEQAQSVENAEFEQTQKLLERERELEALQKDLQSGPQRKEDWPRVSAEDIAEVVSMWTGIPVMQLAEAESARLMKMEDALRMRIIGQDEAITVYFALGAPGAGRIERSQTADRIVHLPGPDRGGQDRTDQSAGRIHVRQRRSDDPAGHDRVHRAAHGQPAGGRAARIHRFRGSRPADRSAAPPPVFDCGVR